MRMAEGKHNIENYILIAVFLVMIILPLVSFIVPIDKTPYMLENRRLVQDPGFESVEDAVTNFPEKFEPYFNDQFGFRRLFVRVSNFLNSRFEGNIVSNLVLTGKQGWLYRHMQYYYRHEFPMSKEDLEKAGNSLRSRQKWFADRGIKHLLVICPLKATIYPEYLPDNMHRPNGVSMIDQLVEYLEGDGSVNFLDLRPVLKEARKEREIYTPSDFHWNDYGALAAAEAVGERIKEWYPQVEVVDGKGFHVSEETHHGGELAVGLGLSNVFQKKEVTFEPEIKNDRYFKYFHNRGGLLISSNGKSSYPNIMFVHDSFGEKLRKFLSMMAAKSIFYWDVAPRKGLADAWKPDLVVEMYMETNTLKNVVNSFWPDEKLITYHEGLEFEIPLPASSKELILDIRSLNYCPKPQVLKATWGGKALSDIRITRKGDKLKIALSALEDKGEYPIFKATYAQVDIPGSKQTRLELPFDLYLASATNQRPTGLYYLQGQLKETARGYNLIRISEDGRELGRKTFDINNSPDAIPEFAAALEQELSGQEGYLLLISNYNIRKGFTSEVRQALKKRGSKARLKKAPHMGHFCLWDLKQGKVIAEHFGLESGIAWSGEDPIEKGFVITSMQLK